MSGSMIFSFVIVGALFLWVGKIIRDMVMPNKHGVVKHCMTCGADTQAKTVTKGSMGVELLLWLCFIIPGLIYSVWRVSSRFDACSSCGATSLVPFDSPAAVAHRNALGVKHVQTA